MVITFKDVSFRYTDKNLLDKVSFSITDQDKTGLVGLNGTGKSTLIKLIEDEIRPQSGEIIKSGNMIISYLEQEPDIPLNTKILDYVMKNNDKDHKVNDYEAKSMLTKLKLDPEALTNNLSGGQRKRLALAKCLVTYCDFLILDEPTNHLDNDMILYLESIFKGIIMAYLWLLMIDIFWNEFVIICLNLIMVIFIPIRQIIRNS